MGMSGRVLVADHTHVAYHVGEGMGTGGRSLVADRTEVACHASFIPTG